MLLTALLSASGIACAKRDRAPDAELLVVSADSTFWVTSTNGAVRVRGVPMLVARVDGRFHEIYVADDDQSYFDAVFVSHRLFSRDLERGDSVELHSDSLVRAMARSYAIEHPGEAPLSPDDPENDNASIRATGDIEILGLHGPYLSFEHHTDIDSRNGDAAAAHQHAYRRGVLDVRTGGILALPALFAREPSDSAINAGRREWKAARDSLLVSPGLAAPRTRRAIADFAFDPLSFTIGSASQAPTVRFAVPAVGHNPDLEPIELAPRRLPSPEWWRLVVAELPRESGNLETWARSADTLVVAANHDAHLWAVRLKLGASDAHAVVRLSSAVDRVLWLDGSVSASARKALTRAFAEASEYDGGAPVAANQPGSAPVTLASAHPFLHLPSHDHVASKTTRQPNHSRVAARNVGADDAAGRKCAWTRVRRRPPRDARQDGGRLRDAACTDALRHGIG